MPARKSVPPKPSKPKTKPTAAPHGPSEGQDKPAISKDKATPAKKLAAPRKPGGAAASNTMTAPGVDWERIELDYRAGIKSVREIAAERGVSHTAVNKRAKLGGWTRDLKARVKAHADAMVSRATVSAEVSIRRVASEAETVEVEATVQARIRLTHRADIGRARRLAMTLLEELEQQSAQVPELMRLGQIMYSPDESGTDKLNQLYQKIIALPSRTKTMKDLSDTLRVLVALEREAFSIDSEEGGGKDQSAPDMLREFFGALHSAAKPGLPIVAPGSRPIQFNPLVKG